MLCHLRLNNVRGAASLQKRWHRASAKLRVSAITVLIRLRPVPSVPVAWPALAVSNEVIFFCAPDRPFVACVSLASGVVGPWSVYRLKHEETQSEFELQCVELFEETRNWNLHLSLPCCYKMAFHAPLKFCDFGGH